MIQATPVDEVSIDSVDSLLRWLETGKQLARDFLLESGFPARLVAVMEQPPALVMNSGDSWIDKETKRVHRLTEETAAALEMFNICDRIARRVVSDTPRWQLVTDGADLIDCRLRILEAVWRADEERSRQRARAAKGGAALKAKSKAKQANAKPGERIYSKRHQRRLNQGKPT